MTAQADESQETTEDGIPVYQWGSAPGHLATRGQLSADGLRAQGDPAGAVWWKRERRWLYLYDRQQAAPKRVPTPAQRAALDRGRQLATVCPGCESGGRGDMCDRCDWAPEVRSAILTARRLLQDPSVRLVDTETTGLDGYTVQLAVTDARGRPLLDTLVNPRCEIEPGAQRVHGIGSEDVRDAPTFAQLRDRLADALGQDVIVVAYNAAFDRAVFGREARRAGWQAPLPWPGEWTCAMHLRSSWEMTTRWLKLGGPHGALGDCQAVAALLARMAGSSLPEVRDARR